ncbi:hypothetical protein GCM10010401_21180 [Rarobacter faecitabidus]|uniref:Uncharacterized protein n=1 Tax=Rarobacter faecitabidus TaxID=13243 RepID=A0A542ZVF1_RARFA|nr:hypothetical protein [Rarobacter faecitabidus]TQL64322.1 hypothetical protein FB461_0824 [Rarobacter faecitabidus]
MEDEVRVRGIDFHLDEETDQPSGSHLGPTDFTAFVDESGSGWTVTGLSPNGDVVTYRIVVMPEAVGRQRTQAACYVDDEIADPIHPHGGASTSVCQWYQWIRAQDAAGNAATWERAGVHQGGEVPRNQSTGETEIREGGAD